MRIRELSGIAIALTLAVAGCGGSNEGYYETGTTYDIGTLWGEESSADRERRLAQEQRIRTKVPVTAVRSVEMGRTRDGFLITAFGTAPGLGYSLPVLRARRGGRPDAEGYVEFDFVATEPAPGAALPPGSSQARAMRADLAVAVADLKGISGIRVLARSGGVQVDF